MNQGSNFIEGSFSSEDNGRTPIQFRRGRQTEHLNRLFFSRTDLSIFTSIAPVLFDRSNKTSSFFPALKSLANLEWASLALTSP